MRKQLVLTMLLAIMLAGQGLKAEPASQPEQPPANNDMPAASDEGLEEPQADEKTGTATDNRQRAISSAIETFTPTEEISADNAVPFPVDI